VMAGPDALEAARALRPIHERRLFGRTLLIFDGLPREQLAGLGEVRTPSLADLFVAIMGGAAAPVGEVAA